MNSMVSINTLKASIENKQILNGIDLEIKPGHMHVIMGPNGSGKSSLAYTMMGHPAYQITDGQINFNGQSILNLSPDKRAKLGIFLAMQHPAEIEGIALKNFLRQAYNTLYDGTPQQLRLKEFAQHLLQKLHTLNMDSQFVERSLNVGFSGGEKKRAEMLQLAVLQPKFAILDEIDSGLDIDALKAVCHALNVVRKDNPDMSILLITHYKRILDHLSPNTIHVMRDGKIVRSGGPELADELEKDGYKNS